MSNEFPIELRQFVAQHVESLAQLETLLVLHREPQQSWSFEELARQLYISVDMCQDIVLDLERRGFAVRDVDNRFRYGPRDADLDRAVQQLAALYRDRRVAVITEIYSRPTKKVQTFADAFRLRKEDPP